MKTANSKTPSESSRRFPGRLSPSSLATMLNTIVKVEGVTKSDGSLYAKEVEGIESSSGIEVEGLITQVIGTPATQVTFLAQSGMGSGVDDNTTGASFTVDVSGAQ